MLLFVLLLDVGENLHLAMYDNTDALLYNSRALPGDSSGRSMLLSIKDESTS